MLKSKAILYPRCYIKKKTGSFAALFFKELFVVVPSKSDIQKLAMDSFEDYALEVAPFLPGPIDDKAKGLEAGIKALTSWGEQVGLGQSVTFETFYLSLGSAQDQEIQSVVNALKGDKHEDRQLAARAFLALSVEADRREDELEVELEKVDERAKRISELVEDESMLSGAQDRYYYIRPINKAKERLRAWARLAFSDKNLPEAWPLGESIAVKDLMDSAYESLSGGKTVSDIMTVYLPLDEDLLKNHDLIFKTRAIFSDILELIDGVCDDSIRENSEFQELSSALFEATNSKRWQEALGPRLILSIYPGFSWRQIVAAAARLDQEDASIKGASQGPCCSFFIV